MKKLLICVLLLAGCAARPPAPCTLATLAVELHVQRVIDGDTVVLEGGERVRLLGINAPELRDPGGLEARNFLAALLAAEGPERSRRGTPVRVDRHGHDRYGRTLAHLFLPDGRSLARLLLAAGHAQLRK